MCSAEEGDAIVKAGLDAFGTIDVLVANAGILRDKSFQNMDEKMWDQVIAVHLRGTYKVCDKLFVPALLPSADGQCVKACWPVFQKQKYGRIVTTASPNGLCEFIGASLRPSSCVDGTIGQANYSTAKAAIIGLTRTLAIEGGRSGIQANCIAPRAGTAMTATVWPKLVNSQSGVSGTYEQRSRRCHVTRLHRPGGWLSRLRAMW